jgi:hypothetical protein
MSAEHAAELMADDPNPFVCDGQHNTGGILATGGIAGPVKNASERRNLPTHKFTVKTCDTCLQRSPSSPVE